MDNNEIFIFIVLICSLDTFQNGLINNIYYICFTYLLFDFQLGEYDRNKPENEEQHMRVEKIFIHPEFNNLKNLDNDIALLKLTKSAQMTDHVNTVSLC